MVGAEFSPTISIKRYKRGFPRRKVNPVAYTVTMMKYKDQDKVWKPGDPLPPYLSEGAT